MKGRPAVFNFLRPCARTVDVAALTLDLVGNAIANNAPVLDSTKSPTLAAELEDAPAPVGSVGTLVSSLVDFASPAGQVDNVTDADSGASLGIAITAANTANGTCGPRRTFPCLV